VGVGAKLYRYNGIERNDELGLDLAAFRSYDPAIGRWLQVDPLAEIMPSMTPYRFGFNNPVLWSDPLGLFESRKEAKKHRRTEKNGLNWFNSNIKKQKDGSFAIETRTSSTQRTTDQSLIADLDLDTDFDGGAIFTSALAKAPSETFSGQMTTGPDKIAPLGFFESKTVGRARYNRDGYYLGVAPKGGGGIGEYIGGGGAVAAAAATAKYGGLFMAATGWMRVKKASVGIKAVGSKKTLVYSALLFKLRARWSLGRKVPTMIGPSASSFHTAVGRNAIPIGLGTAGAGYGVEKLLEDE
jgi:RHS repeat-associated protein